MTTPPVSAALVDEAVALAHSAGALTRRYFAMPGLRVEQKADGSPVTDADRDAESLIRSELARRYPHDAVLGEEHPDTSGASGRRWFIDPIDGTRSFVHGVPLYATLVAFEDAYGPAIGVIYLPALDETIHAGRGRGCFWNGRPARVSDHAATDGALVTATAFDWSVVAQQRLREHGAILRGWGDAYGYALVATGRAEAMVDAVVHPWDVAPMPIILSEAGGRFTSLAGTDGIDHGTGFASNGRLHARLLALVAG